MNWGVNATKSKNVTFQNLTIRITMLYASFKNMSKACIQERSGDLYNDVYDLEAFYVIPFRNRYV